MCSKNYASRKNKMFYDLKMREYLCLLLKIKVKNSM